MRNIQGEETRRRILVTFAQQPAPTLDELSAATGKSNLNYHIRRLVQQGQIIAIAGPHAARRWRLASDPLHTAARLLVARAERRGGYAVVPWAAVEAIEDALG